MNQLATMQKTMSSLEIVEMINNHRISKETSDKVSPNLRHSDFMAKVINVLGAEYSEKFRSTYLADNGKTNPCYRFYKREACLMAMSYSYELQAKVYDHMTALEERSLKPQLPDFTNPVEAARAWANEVEAKQIAQEQLQLAMPKVEYFDRVADVGNLMTASVVSKKIGMSAQVLNSNLDTFKVYDKRQKGRVFSQWFIDKGYGELKKTDNGFNQSKFTNKGEQWIIEKLTSEGII